MVFQYFCLQARSRLHFAMSFNTFAQNPSQGFLVYMIIDLYSMFLRFFSAFATSILPRPWASVRFARSFLICHGFHLYYLIRYESRFFLCRARLQSVITHFIEPAECIFDFSEVTYFQHVLASLACKIALLQCLSIFLFKFLHRASYFNADGVVLLRILTWVSF